MVIKRERLRVPVPPAAEMHIWDDLHQDFPGLINDVKARYWQSLSLGFHESGERVPGEVFFPQSGVVLYYRVDPNREFIEAGCVLPNGEGTQAFQGFCERIKEAVLPGRKDAQPAWRPFTDSNVTFDLVREEAQALHPTAEQLSGAAALADAGRRHLLRSIHAQRSVLMENLTTTGKSVMEIAQEVGQLESLGLVQKDFVVFCREQGNQISRVGNFSQIEDATRRGFKCFSCGRPIAEERIDQLLSCTPEGTLLARPNYWLSLLLSQSLGQIDIPIEHQVTVPTAEQGRVLDLFATHDGVLMMFEIKEDAIRLDDVFLFFSRARYYRPDVAFFVTTHPVSADVRQYLETAPSDVQVMLLEATDGVEAAVAQVLQRRERERLRDVVRQLEPQTRVDVGSLVFQFFFGKEEKVREAMPEAGEKIAEGALLTPQPEVEPPRPAEEHVPSEETQAADAENKAGAQPLPVPEERTPSELAEPQPHLAAETAPLDETDLMPLGDTLGDMSMGMMQEEMLIDQPILEIQEVFDMGEMGAQLDRPVGDEEREATLRRVVDDVVANGVLGRSEVLAALLADINALPNLSSALVTDDGLVLAEALGSKLPSEMVAGLASEIHDQVQRSLEEFDGGRATRILVESMADKLHLRPAGEGAILVVREERPMREMEEEFAGALPGEMVLREAMLKKVLEDLSMVEGVRGGIVASRDGLAIDYSMEHEDVPADVLSAILSLIVVENEKLCKKLQLYPIRQISVRTDGALYSLIPLDKEGILITMLEPGSPREVWQNRLYAAANMLTSVFQ